MDEVFIISIYDNLRKEWKYASIYDVGYDKRPEWTIFQDRAETFYNVEDAEEWFNKSKSYLNTDYYDSSTLAIRKVIYQVVKKLR